MTVFMTPSPTGVTLIQSCFGWFHPQYDLIPIGYDTFLRSLVNTAS